MVVGFGLPQKLAQGTSLAAILPTAMVAAATHARTGDVAFGPAAWMGGIGAVGALAGALLALRMPHQVLAGLFGVFLLFSAFRLWPRGGLRPPAGPA
jgi:uncharacterized membrane protein YfcA